MTKLEIIDSILNDSYRDNSGILVEKNTDTKGKPFEMKREIVTKSGVSYSVYKYQNLNDIFPFFKNNGIPRLKKMCDYVLFIEEQNHLYTYLVELKLGTEPARIQLEAGECFINYIISTTNRLGMNLNVNADNFHVRKIRVSESRSKKKSLKKGIFERENGVIEHDNARSFHLNKYMTY